MTFENFSSLSGKVAVLTGASRGIGKSIADSLIANGAKVVIGDLLVDEGQASVDSYNKQAGDKVAAFIRCDVTKYSDNIALFQLAESEFGGVDLALLNAGIARNSNSMFSPLDDKLDELIIDINTTAVIKGTKVALLHMAKRGGGSIIHLASVAGFFSSPGLASYNASKHGVIGYTRSFSLMPQICNVRVNAVCPFWVETDLLSTVVTHGVKSDSLTELIKVQPRTAIQTVVDAFLTLATDESRNAQTLMALPTGLEIMEPLESHPSFVNETIKITAYPTFIRESIAEGKAALAVALERYQTEKTIE